MRSTPGLRFAKRFTGATPGSRFQTSTSRVSGQPSASRPSSFTLLNFSRLPLDKLEERVNEQVRLTKEVEAIRIRLAEESQERQRRAQAKRDVYSRIMRGL